MVAGVIITTEMETTELAESSYEAISKAVGGYIQIVPLQNDFAGYSMYLHEEGKLIGLPMNDIATAVWENSYGRTDIILGNAVIVNANTDDDGNELPISEDDAESLMAKLRLVFVKYATN
jgi:hypothetical protein